MYKLIIVVSALLAFITSNAQKGSGKMDTTQQAEELTAHPAEFKGGKSEMLKFIQANLKYPDIALKNKTQGKVVLRFVVDEEGKLSEVGIIKGLSKECDEEAMRLVKSMPAWTPARDKKHEIVAEATSLTIEFKLPQ